ncbi:MAG: MarR family transcriptional regulator [Thermoanaerobaculia bacterium]
MSGRLSREIRQATPMDAAQEAFLNVLRTAAVLECAVGRILRPAGLTQTQYNALRILRGAHPRALPCSSVGERMVTPVPDVTRLLDRLERRGWVERRRATADRRVVEVGITAEGRALLARLDPRIETWIAGRFAALRPAAVEALIEALETLRDEPEEDDDE